MSRVAVAVPVMSLGYEVEVLHQAALMPLDVLVLAGVDAGYASAPALVSEFRLAPRLVDISIVRLIDEDLVRLNPASGQLTLTETAAIACKEDRLNQLVFRGEPQFERFRVLRDLTWGGVAEVELNREGMRLGAPGDALCLPRNHQLESPLQFGSSKIAALYNALGRTSAELSARRVAVSGRLIASSSSHLIWELLPYRNGDSVDFSPVGQDSNWSQPALRILLARVRRWLHESPDKWRHLVPALPAIESDVRRHQLFVPFTAYGPLLELGERLRRASAGDEERVSELRDQCERAYANRAVLRIVRNEGHIEACRSLLQRSVEFCVIHSAFWSDAGISQFRDDIVAALRRGAHVYLMRGLGDEEEADVELPALAQLVTEAKDTKGRLLVSQAPHHSHAKFVVSDGRAAVVSSFNFLGATKDNPQLNVGVFCEAEASAGGLGVSVLRNLMEHALPGDLLAHLEEQVTRLELQAPAGGGSQGSVHFDPVPDIREWMDGLREPKCAWELITNEIHRDALLGALHTAESSVTITSGDLTRSAVDAVVQRYMQDAVRRGVTVKVLWGSQTRDTSEQAQMAALADELARDVGSPRFIINRAPRPVHAKLLVVDGWVSIVSSYNFLSYRGLRFGAHELGLKVYSRSLAGQLERIVDELVS